jgi:hypothetical protein
MDINTICGRLSRLETQQRQQILLGAHGRD